MAELAITIGEQGEGLAAAMDMRFGRAARFLMVDPGADQAEAVVTNPAVMAAHGAGTGAAAMMREQGVKAVVSGRFGPKAADALRAMAIEMYIAPPGLTAGEAARRYAAGELERQELQVFR